MALFALQGFIEDKIKQNITQTDRTEHVYPAVHPKVPVTLIISRKFMCPIVHYDKLKFIITKKSHNNDIIPILMRL